MRPSKYVQLFELFLEDPKELEDAIETDLTVSRDDVHPHLTDQAGLYFKWARLAAIAESRAERQKILVKEDLAPRARKTARTLLGGETKKPTEKAIEDQALMDLHYKAGVTLLHDLEEVAATLKGAERAMAQRAEMLRSLNSRQRVELQS